MVIYATPPYVLLLHLLTIKVCSFWLPQEVSPTLIRPVSPPQAGYVINGLEKAHPEATSIVVGDFNMG